MSEKRPSKPMQHEQVRVPQGWTGQARMLVIQINNVLTDLYSKIGKIEERLKKLEE